MTEEQVIALLRAIYIMASLPYPFPDRSEVHTDLAMTMGEIMGLANRALSRAKAREEEPT